VLRGRGDRPRDARLARHVTGDAERAAPGARDPLGDGIRSVDAHVEHRDGGAVLCQQLCARRADAAAAHGDEGVPARQCLSA